MSINETIIELAENCETNNVDLTDLFCEFRNAAQATIEEDGNIQYNLSNDEYGWQAATEEDLEAFAEWVDNQ